MKPIGGYFELELAKDLQTYHQTHTFKSGRSALHFILDFVKAKKIYIPFYTCDALLEPINIAGVDFEFYQIDENLEPATLPDLQEHELFLYINYYDGKRDYVESLLSKYKTQLIVDCTQAFFMKGDGAAWYFNSCRKFFGVPDGAYLYAPNTANIKVDFQRNDSFTMEHLLKRMQGHIKEGYPFYRENEKQCDSKIRKMSLVTEKLLSLVNYKYCEDKRVQNFSTLHKALKNENLFNVPQKGIGVPMYYPFLPKQDIPHQQLWDNEIFAPVLWNDVLQREEVDYKVEKHLSSKLLPLPVDHRYGIDDMKHIINLLKRS